MPVGVAVSAETAKVTAAAAAEAGDEDGEVENDRFGRLLKGGCRREAKGTANLRETTARIDEDTVSFVVRHAQQASDGRKSPYDTTPKKWWDCSSLCLSGTFWRRYDAG